MLPDKRSIRYRSIDRALIGSRMDFRSTSVKKGAHVEQNICSAFEFYSGDRQNEIRVNIICRT